MSETVRNSQMSGADSVLPNYSMYLGETPTKYHQVKIDRVANGFVVEIGCKKFVGENWEVLAKKLGEYWKDPVAAEKKYCK